MKRLSLLKLILLLAALFLNVSLIAQQYDSLRRELYNTREDKVWEVETNLAEQYLNKNVDSANFFAIKLLENKNLPPELLVRCALVRSKVLYRRDSIAQAMFELLRVEDQVSSITNSWYVMNYHMIRAYLSELNSDYEDAIKQNQQGLLLALSEKDTVYLARFRNNLGLAYKVVEEYADAIEQLKLAVPLFIAIKQPIYANSAYMNIGAAYLDMAMYDSAMVYLERSAKFFKENNSYYELASYFGNMANIAYLENQPLKAIAMLHHKLTCLDSAEDRSTRPTIHLKLSALEDLGRAHLFLKHEDSASYYYRWAFSIARSQNLLDYMSSSSKNLSSIMERTGLIDSALIYYKTFVACNDSLLIREGRDKAIRLKADFELTQLLAKEEQLAALEKEEQKQILFIYTIVVLILLVILAFFYGALQRNRKKQREKELMELKLKAQKRKLERNLLMKENDLMTKQVKLSETETRIEHTLKELKEVLLDNEVNPVNRLQELANKMEGRSSRKAMVELDNYLQESDKRLFEALSMAHPNLTRSELRLCAFMRLNLSTKEIAMITHQNVNSIKMARYRLRKKLGVENRHNLVSYLNNLVSDNA